IAAVPVLGRRLAGVAHDAAHAGQRFPFIGRTGLLADIGRVLDGFVDGAVVRLAVIAPPGQGKSRLGSEIAVMAERRGIALFRGTSSAASTVGPLQPFRQIYMALPAQPLAGTGPESIVAALRAQVATGPTILVLDDWQWADSASVSLLGRLRDVSNDLGIVLLSRERGAGSVPLDGFTEVRLAPLTIDETTALVRSRRSDLDPLDAARIHDRAGGNPLLTEELCLLDPRTARTVLRNGSEPIGSGWLASLVAVRIEQLQALERRVLDTAAVIGITPPRWLLDTLVGPAGAVAAIPELVEMDFMVGQAGDAIAFKHGITWEIIYSLVPLETRRRLHAAIADVLERRADTPDIDLHESLAWHYLASDQPERSWPHAEQAGDRAVALGSLDRAQIHYRQAIDTLDSRFDTGTDADYARYATLVGKFGFSCVFDAEEAQLALFEQAIRRAQRRRDRVGEAKAEYWLGYIAHGFGNARRAIIHCQRALVLTDEPPDAPFPVQVRATLGQAHAMAANYTPAAALLDEAIAIKRAHRSGRKISVGLAYTLALRAALHGDTGDFGTAHAMIAEALDLIGGEPHPVEASVLSWHAAICAWQGDWEGLRATAERGCAVAQRIEAVYIHAISRAFASYAQWQIDGSNAAADGLVSAVACMVDRGKTLALSIASGFVADVEQRRGNVVAARSAAALAFQRARLGEPMGLAWAARAWARQLAPQSPDRARVFIARARSNAERRSSPHELARCDLEAVRLGLAADRDTTLAQALAAFERMEMHSLAAEARALMHAG
ncbi:MAG TPA: hypothetical protein PK808_03645, partial [Polymorphobacter sp.]|nr:hypothetical protein [Polymorphobacter sp.]